MGEEQNHQGILHEIYIGSQGHRCCRHVRFGSISGVAPAADFPATILGQGTRAVCSSCSPSTGESHLLVSQRGGGGTLGTLFTALAMLVAALRIIPESMFTSISTRFPLSVGVFQLCACDGAGVGGRCTEPASTLALMRFRHRRALCSLRININSESLCKYLREISPTLRQLRAKHRCNLPYQS